MNPLEVIPVSRRRPTDPGPAQHSSWVEADLARRESVGAALTPGCTVINVAYAASASGGENIAMAEALVHACREARVARLVHCSTAVVIGDSREINVDENTPCLPATPYEMTKYRIEQTILEANVHFPVYVLRPTAVLGPGGQNLRKLLSEIVGGSQLTNFLRSAIYGSRRMNLVPVTDVVGALLFLAGKESPAPGIYICAADDDADNRYDRVERIMRGVVGKPQRLRAIRLPATMLNFLLRLTRSGTARMADRTYSADKLASAGYQRTDTIARSTREFVLFEMDRQAFTHT